MAVGGLQTVVKAEEERNPTLTAVLTHELKGLFFEETHELL